MAKKRLKMSDPREIRRTLNRIANMLLNGEITPTVANSVIYACNVALGAIRVHEQGKRIEELEMMLEGLTHGEN